MKRLVLVFGIALAFSTTATAVDIAISTQGGWMGQGHADTEAQEIVDNVTGAPIEVFTSTDLDALADWVEAHTGDGASDLLVMFGIFPATIYPAGNAQPDGSLAELFLDDGNCIINTGDYIFYVGSAGNNDAGGLANMMDVPAAAMWGDDTFATMFTPTADGALYTPSLTELPSNRPWFPAQFDGTDWEFELILAQTADGSQAHPAILKNAVTGGRVGVFFQIGQNTDSYARGEVISEWINNWYLPNLGGSNPLARGPDPKDGSMIDQTSVQASWNAGDFAEVHDVYFGDSAEAVEAATRDDADIFVATVATTTVPIGDDEPLVPGKTYYWRVDAVNDANAASPWTGPVWSFRVRPQIAWNPTPGDGVLYVTLEQDLNWEPGINTLFHTVYFGESFDEVSEAVAGGMMLTGLTFDPGSLAVDTTYYWRVDEFTFPGSATYKGDVWSFTTVPDIPVADDLNLTLWYTLGEGMGSTAVDWSGHGNHGNLRGDPQWIDGALTFDGRNDYVSVLLDVSETEYAAALWFKTTNGNCGLMAVVQNDLGGGGHDRHIYLTGGNIKIRLWDTEEIETVGLNLADGLWHHVVYTYGADVGGQKLYVDGVLQASGTKDASDFDWQERVNIGFSNDAARDYFEGVLEDVRIYDKTLSEEEVQQVMRGDPLLAWNPQPPRGVTIDIRDATALNWSAGDTAASHDVYLGTNRDAVAAAGRDAAEYRGNQPGTSLSLAGLAEFGGGAYYWRIDEVEADGTVHTGTIWKFTVPAYLVVDDFESYDDADHRLYEIWVDGVVNGTGSYVGYDVANNGTFGETVIVHSGGQSMPIQYDNTVAPGISEADRTFTPAQNWTARGVTTLVIHFRGAADNTGQLYAKINGTKVPYDGDPADIATRRWIAWEINLAATGINAASVSTLTIGIEGGGTGTVYVDDIWLTKP